MSLKAGVKPPSHCAGPRAGNGAELDEEAPPSGGAAPRAGNGAELDEEVAGVKPPSGGAAPRAGNASVDAALNAVKAIRKSSSATHSKFREYSLYKSSSSSSIKHNVSGSTRESCKRFDFKASFAEFDGGEIMRYNPLLPQLRRQ